MAKFPEIRHAPRTKKCVHPSIVSCAYFTTSLRVDRVSIAFISEKNQRPASGSQKILRPTRAKELQSFRKFSARRAQKGCIDPASVISRTSKLRCSSFASRCAFYCKIRESSETDPAKVCDFGENNSSYQNFFGSFSKRGTQRKMRTSSKDHFT